MFVNGWGGGGGVFKTNELGQGGSKKSVFGQTSLIDDPLDN